MTIPVIKPDERAIFALRSLYETYGYQQYKMNKFEEYDMYLRNKDFLVSDHVITFTDTDGKLMALKPDVTLSIVKNTADTDGVQKVYYNENVYRVARGGGGFREIMQVGLECLGNTDDYCLYETLLLAAKSLQLIADDFVLDVSHMGVVVEVMDSLGLSADQRSLLLKAMAEKNPHDIAAIDGAEKLQKLIAAYGSAAAVRGTLEELYPAGLSAAAAQLLTLVEALEAAGFAGKVRIDFSVLNDCKYYNGIVFQGFVSGIPTDILSGGQYDPLMKKLGRHAGAVGFAVYMDRVNQLAGDTASYDVDTVVVYSDRTPLDSISAAVDAYAAEGSTRACPAVPSHLTYRQLVKLDEKGAMTVETHA